MSHSKVFDSTFEKNIDELIDHLAEEGYATISGFLNPADCDLTLDHIRALSEADAFKKAGMGKQIQFQVKKHLRGDFIHWLQKDQEPLQVQSFLDKIEYLKQELNRTCFLSLKDYETHYTYYPENTRYIRHRDQFQNTMHRLISFVCYLAPNWKDTDGGQLNIYFDDRETVQILPEQGLLVCFKSELEHEVLQTHRERYSITGWMLDQPVKLTFL